MKAFQRNRTGSLFSGWYLLLVAMSAASFVTHATASTTEATATVVAEQFKAPNSQTPKDLAMKWKNQDEELWNYVEQQVPAVLDHTGSASFDEHLKGVQAVLRYWNAPEYLCSAGLFHSIYGTEG